MNKILLSSAILLLLFSCKHEPSVSPTKICYSSQIQPLLNSFCGECHSSNSEGEGNELLVDSYEHLVQSELVKAGKPFKSPLYNAIVQQNKIAPNYIPPSHYARLSTNQTNLILQWILQGAENTNCDTLPCDTANTSYANTIAPIINNNCIGCHSITTPSGGIVLSSYASIKAIVNNGQLKASVIDRSSTPMPPTYTINACSINQLNNWINNGMPEN